MLQAKICLKCDKQQAENCLGSELSRNLFKVKIIAFCLPLKIYTTQTSFFVERTADWKVVH